MGLTITEKILAKASGKKMIEPGEIIEANIDLVMGTDVMLPVIFEVIEKIGALKVFDSKKVVSVIDHFSPAPNIGSANQNKMVRESSRKYCIDNVIELGEGGVCHVVLPERGLVAPGEVIVGSDSHTTTYGALGAFSTGLGSTDTAVAMAIGKLWFKVPGTIKVIFNGSIPNLITGKDLILYLIGKIGAEGARYKTLEFTGEVIEKLNMDARFTICNMAVEAGAKNAIIEPDNLTLDYLKKLRTRPYEIVKSDLDAEYENEIGIDCSSLEPQVAHPHSPDNVYPISQSEGIKVDQVYIGSCTNGRISDLRLAAKLLKDKKVHPEVRLIVTPGSREVYLQTLKEGLISIFIEAGAIVNSPSCGACFGGHFGILADGEVCLSTTNRNFKGRMGSKEGKIYLSSPAVAAATAIKGEISDPRRIIDAI